MAQILNTKVRSWFRDGKGVGSQAPRPTEARVPAVRVLYHGASLPPVLTHVTLPMSACTTH